MNIQIGQKIKQSRKQAGLTLKDLADRTGLSISYLSLLERGMNKPTVENLNTVCRALDIALQDLISGIGSPEDIVVRSGQRRMIFQTHGYSYEAATNGKGVLSCIVMTVNDDTEHISQPHIADEIGYVISGAIIYTVNGVDYKLKAGDCIYIPAGSPHSYQKVGEGESVTVFFSTTQSQNKSIENHSP